MEPTLSDWVVFIICMSLVLFSIYGLPLLGS